MDQDGLVLEYAAKEFKADNEVVMKAVTQNGRALQYVAKELKADKEVVMKAVTQYGIALVRRRRAQC